ncbi:hypothetical protein, partial [Lactobacillus gasseri]|uniref:hypothetical protein n=1 Tax=Lactobacillus gasseri TaxID=1596 RepID=UPI0027F36986
GFSVMSRVSSAGLFVRINLFRRFIFRKNVQADFYGLSDIDSVVTDFDPNKERDPQTDTKRLTARSRVYNRSPCLVFLPESFNKASTFSFLP